jgi:hypothetical protein
LEDCVKHYTITLHPILDLEARTVGPAIRTVSRWGTLQGAKKLGERLMAAMSGHDHVLRVVGPVEDVWYARVIKHTETASGETVSTEVLRAVPYRIGESGVSA